MLQQNYLTYRSNQISSQEAVGVKSASRESETHVKLAITYLWKFRLIYNEKIK